MNINNKLLNDIESYCKLNELNVEEFVNDLLKKAFMLEKYGEKPPFMVKKDVKVVEEPKVVEVAEEVTPVETPTEPVVEVDQTEEFKLVEKKTEKKTRKRKLA